MKKKKLFSILLIAVLALAVLATAACQKKRVPAGDEAGVYFFESVVGEEYLITLGGNKEFVFSAKNETEFGTYTLKDKDLIFTFDGSKDGLSANYQDETITLTYTKVQSGEMRFIKKIMHTVTFNSNGGSEVDKVLVPNGKTVSKPENPVKEGFSLIGWYTDDTFKDAFSFDSQIITQSITLLARWGQPFIGQSEFTVDFDLNYTGAPANPQSKTTVGGKLYDALTPSSAPAGATFGGWWVSTLDDGEKLTYKWSENVVFKENTTLYAFWQFTPTGGKNAAPVVQVDSTSISWTAITGVNNFRLDVAGPEGFDDIVNEKLTGGVTKKEMKFSSYPAGDYIITVTALGSAEEYNAVTVRGFRNKALSKVSLYEIIDSSTLLFKGVANATKYLIDIDCGNSLHNHKPIDNGTSTFYNFANCPMKTGGITFKITAKAGGWASSVSKEIKFERNLSKVSGLHVDEDTQTLLWDEVPDATNYIVTVAGEDKDNGNKTSYSLKEYPKGDIKVSVLPKARGYNSPAKEEFTYKKENLASPKILGINGRTVTWTSVTDATSYDIEVAGETFNTATKTESYDLPLDLVLAPDTDYELKVMAKGKDDSLWSQPVVIRDRMPSEISYFQSVASWSYVLGLEAYEIKINDGEITKITGLNHAEVTLDAGLNTVYVRPFNATADLQWSSTQVYAHTIILNGRGAAVVQTEQKLTQLTQYKALGDRLLLPELAEDGHEFSGWYNTPGGAASNGAAFTDTELTVTGDLLLYAYFIPETCTALYDTQGGALAKTETKIAYNSDFTMDVPAVTAQTQTGFIGWFDEDGVKLTDELGKGIGTWKKKGTVTVFANYAQIFVFETASADTNTLLVKAGKNVDLVTTLVIPSEYNGVAVTEVFALQSCLNVVTIEIPATITYINPVAFENCTKLININVDPANARYTSKDGFLLEKVVRNGKEMTELARYPLGRRDSTVVIPGYITSIGDSAFSNFTTLTTLTISEGVEYIGYSAFRGCKGLYELTIPGSVEVIGVWAFMDCTGLRKVTVTEGVKEIGSSCFSRTTTSTEVLRLAEVNLPSSLVKIGDEAFRYCSELTTLNLDEAESRLQEIGEGAFASCTALASIKIPASVTTIGKEAFKGCYILGGSAPNYVHTGLKTVTFENGSQLNKIGEGAFNGCKLLEGIIIPSGVTAIEKDAFKDCYILISSATPAVYGGLKTVEFEQDSQLNEIGESAFNGCKILEEITIPASVTLIGKEAFANCAVSTESGKGLKTVNLQKEDTAALTIGESAFLDCLLLSALDFKGGQRPVTLEENAFSGCSMLKAYNIPGLAGFVLSAFPTGFNSITVSSTNPIYRTQGGVLLKKLADNKFEIALYPIAKDANNQDSYTFPANVISIGEGAFYGNTKLKKIEIPAGITKIGASAFKDCTAIAQVIFNGTDLDEIGDNAFENCIALTGIAIPDGLLTIGKEAFKNCSNTAFTSFEITANLANIGENAFNGTKITSFILNASNMHFSETDGVIYDKDQTKIICFPSVKTTLTLPDTLTVIPDGAFANSGLISVIIPDGVTSIGAAAFRGCASLTSITIPETVITIGAEAFYGCSNSGFTTVTFEGTSRLTTIGNGAFRGCSNLDLITLPDSLIFIGEGSFQGCVKLTSIEIPADVESIGGGAFQDCGSQSNPTTFKGLSTVTFAGTSLAQISDSVFSGCYALATITLPAGITSIGSSAFKNCKSLVSINIPASVTKIGNEAFSGCGVSGTAVGLTTVNFESPSVLTEIGANAFNGCNRLTEVVLPDSIQVLASGAFNACIGLTTINIPADLIDFSLAPFSGCTNLKEYTVTDDNQGYSTDGKVLFNKDKTTIIRYLSTVKEAYEIADSVTSIQANAFSGRSITSITIPASVTFIGANAFSGCSSLASVIFTGESQLKEIGESTFEGCSVLSSITIPDGVNAIGARAFYGCSKITNITLPLSLETIEPNTFTLCLDLLSINIPAFVTSIGNNAFDKAIALTTLTFGDAENESRLTHIGTAAFYQCGKLTNITLPDGLLTLNPQAFAYCTGLKRMVIPKNLRILNNSFMNCTNLKAIIFQTDEQGNYALEEIGINAFQGCGQIDNIIIPASVTRINTSAFGGWLATQKIWFPGRANDFGFVNGWNAGCNVAANNIIWDAQLNDLPDLSTVGLA